MKFMKNAAARLFTVLSALVMLIAACPSVFAADSAKVGLSRTSVSIDVGESMSVKLLNATGKIKWAVSDSDIITYSKGKVTGLSEGKAYLYATNGGKRYKCLVTVHDVDDSVKADVSSITIKKGSSGKVLVFTGGKKVLAKCNAPGLISMSCGNIINNRFYLTIKGKKTGTCTLTVYNKKDPSECFKIKVKITDSGDSGSSGSAWGTSVTVGGSDNTDDSTALSEDEYIDEVIRLVNIERESEGLTPFVKNDDLCAVADVRAKELVKLFSHTRPDGTSCFTAFSEAGIKSGFMGENIAQGYRTPEEVVKGWMNSKLHRENILNSGFTDIGIGYDSASKSWVQEFMG